MRPKRENCLFEEKSFLSEPKTTLTQAACLNRIYRKVNMAGLAEGALEELHSDLDYVCKRYHIDDQSAILLAGILVMWWLKAKWMKRNRPIG